MHYPNMIVLEHAPKPYTHSFKKENEFIKTRVYNYATCYNSNPNNKMFILEFCLIQIIQIHNLIYIYSHALIPY